MDTGNTTWILISIALVLLMTPGLAFFYGGLVRERNAINTIKMSFIALGVVSITWAVCGYSIAFSEGSWLCGGLSWVGLEGVGPEPHADLAPTVPHMLFMAFQMMFAVITPALISGAVVGRMRFRQYLPFIVLWSLCVYSPLAHWVWGPGGWIGEMGALDFAGGTVVHISAGVSALVAAVVLGPRGTRRSADEPHNVPLVILGSSLLWFGWIGFNGGSALAADGIAALATVNTILGGAAAMTAWVLLEMRRSGRPSAIGAAIGCVVGLVAITPGAGFVSPMAAILIGAAGSAVSYPAMHWMKRSRFDDTLDVFACHGIGGIVGALLTGVFATSSVNSGIRGGLVDGNPQLLVVQAVGVLGAIALAGCGTFAVLKVLRLFGPLRATSSEEAMGLDAVEHAQVAYTLESFDPVPPTNSRQDQRYASFFESTAGF